MEFIYTIINLVIFGIFIKRSDNNIIYLDFKLHFIIITSCFFKIKYIVLEYKDIISL